MKRAEAGLENNRKWQLYSKKAGLGFKKIDCERWG
jgi:hypothetical protein